MPAFSGTLCGPSVASYLSEVGGLASLVLGDLVHRVLGALLGLAVGPPLFRDVHHLSSPASYTPVTHREGSKYRQRGKATTRSSRDQNELLNRKARTRGVGFPFERCGSRGYKAPPTSCTLSAEHGRT